MPTVNVYLNFNGNCEEAFNFYRTAFGGEFQYVGRFKDMPPQDGKKLTGALGERIMHITLPVSKETVLMGSDTAEGFGPPLKMGNNFSISITVSGKAEADKFFNALSKGGQVVMPMGDTFWGSYFGMFADKFGVNWMVSFDQQNKQ